MEFQISAEELWEALTTDCPNVAPDYPEKPISGKKYHYAYQSCEFCIDGRVLNAYGRKLRELLQKVSAQIGAKLPTE